MYPQTIVPPMSFPRLVNLIPSQGSDITVGGGGIAAVVVSVGSKVGLGGGGVLLEKGVGVLLGTIVQVAVGEEPGLGV